MLKRRVPKSLSVGPELEAGHVVRFKRWLQTMANHGLTHHAE